jgi:hypothetical protein
MHQEPTAVLDLLEKRSAPKALQLNGLTVGDVIAMLETFDPSAPVMVQGESGGFEEVLGFRTTGVVLNVNSAEGFGPHDLPDDGARPDLVAVVVRSAER